MRNKSTKIELARRDNTVVLFSNTPETVVAYKVGMNIDKVFLYMRKNVETKENLPMEKFIEKREAIIKKIEALNNELLLISQEYKIPNLEEVI